MSRNERVFYTAVSVFGMISNFETSTGWTAFHAVCFGMWIGGWGGET